MDYKEKVIALLNDQELSKEQKEKLENIFPELKESENEDEKIRKGLIKAVSRIFEGHKLYDTDVTREEALAWLEKQKVTGEEIIFRPIVGTDIRIAAKQALEKIDTGKKIVLAFNGAYIPVNGKTVGEIDSEYDAWLGMQDEQKPTDNVEPKFKVGNWYQCTKDFFTFDKNTAYYCAKDGFLQNEYGCYIAIIKDLYDNFKLWTIEDAKDGDVLAEDSCIFIIRKLGDNGTAAKTYCVLHDDGDFNYDSELYFDIDSTKPATKEQRDLLFQKIAEAGYEWDSEKKELKKIEPKNPIVNVPPRELILSIWDLGNEWKELTNGCILPEYGTQLDYIQKHWYESEYYLKATQGNKSTEDVK